MGMFIEYYHFNDPAVYICFFVAPLLHRRSRVFKMEFQFATSATMTQRTRQAGPILEYR